MVNVLSFSMASFILFSGALKVLGSVGGSPLYDAYRSAFAGINPTFSPLAISLLGIALGLVFFDIYMLRRLSGARLMALFAIEGIVFFLLVLSLMGVIG